MVPTEKNTSNITLCLKCCPFITFINLPYSKMFHCLIDICLVIM